MRIVVMGSGGLGGYFGGLLAQSGADVTFVARGAHLHALQERGLTVRSVMAILLCRSRRVQTLAHFLRLALCSFA